MAAAATRNMIDAYSIWQIPHRGKVLDKAHEIINSESKHVEG
jgi:hypothetical protein